MKKLTTFLLALLLCCSVFVACTTDNNRPESTPIDSSSIATEDSSTPDSSIVEESALDSAVKYVRALYIMDSATTASDYYVIAQAPVGDQTFDIEWSVDVTEGVAVVAESDKEGMVLIDVTRGSTDVNYVLTATLTDGTDTKSVSFNRVVPFATVNTYAEYAASENGNSLTVRGIVIGWEDKARGDSANSIYLHDLNNEGGYYLYSLSELPAGLAVGVTIEASGEFEDYKGTYELKNVSATVIDSTANPVTPVDYTNAFINAADTKAAELVSRQAMLVTLKGVTITDQDATNGYLNFTLGGKTSYLRISGSHNCITKDEQTAMKALHAASYGSTADVTGYVAIYSGNFYLVPVDANAISNITVPERNDAEKVELEKGALSVTSSVSSDTTLTLPVAGATYEEVAISWASDSEYAVVDGGNVAITVPDEKTTVTLTATLTLNNATDTASFEVVLNKMPTAIAELNALGAAQESYTTAKYIAEGVITKLIISGSYGNLYIKDNNGDELYVYGLYIDGDKYGDYTGSKPVEGDYVRVIGVVGQYKGTPQMKNADLMTFATPHNVASALTLTEGKAYVVATVKEVYNTSYGNMYLTDDGVNSFTIYGSYDVFGNSYDKLAVKPEAGDTVGIYGEISVYKNAPQIKNGVIFYWVKGEVAPSVCPGCNVEGEAHAICEVCGSYTCDGKDHTHADAPAVFSESLDIFATTGSLAADSLSISWAGTNFTFVTEKAAASSDIVTTNYDHFRAYKGTLTTISSLNGAKITRVVITCFGTDSSKYLGSNTVTGATVTSDGAVYTLTAATPVDAITINADSSQWRISNIVVYYIVEVGGDDPAPSCPGCGEVGDAHAVCEVCGEYTCDGEDHTHAPAATCPGCGEEEIHTETCEHCGELLCKDVHAECGKEPVVETITTIAGALAAADGAALVITGTVKHIDTPWNTTHNNISVVITDGTEEILVYRLATNVELYDIITVTGVVGSYNEAKQVAAGATATIDGKHEHTYADGTCTYCGAVETIVIISVTEAYALAKDTPVTVRGIVSSIDTAWSDYHGNITVTITDGTTSFQCYRLATNVAVNDIIVVTGLMDNYYGTVQIAQGATAVIEGKHEHTAVEAWVAGATTHWHVCPDCGAKVGEESHTGGTATATEQAICEVCLTPYGDLAGVTYETITFNFGANGSAAHVDGNDYGTAKSFTSGSYTLALTGMSKVYGPAYDAKGNSCLKLGTSKLVGSFSFTVGENVTKVIIHVANYKAATNGKVKINGTEYALTTTSDSGTYQAIEIDTTTTKTISFEVTTNKRCMINTIEFVVAA